MAIVSDPGHPEESGTIHLASAFEIFIYTRNQLEWEENYKNVDRYEGL